MKAAAPRHPRLVFYCDKRECFLSGVRAPGKLATSSGCEGMPATRHIITNLRYARMAR